MSPDTALVMSLMFSMLGCKYSLCTLLYKKQNADRKRAGGKFSGVIITLAPGLRFSENIGNEESWGQGREGGGVRAEDGAGLLSSLPPRKTKRQCCK